MTRLSETALARGVAALRAADALLIGAGAGMGVDSGLPDFRGPQGFWNAYPPYRALGLGFTDLANPSWFARDPAFAWGFYGHRRNLYRATVPHRGFDVLRRWAESMPYGSFVFTSNVDGHFQAAGFDPERLVEVHGSLEWSQCARGCGVGVVPAGDDGVAVDESTMRAAEPLPACPGCGALARPNVLMFGDWDWDSSRTDGQIDRFRRWLSGLDGARLVVVECGAGPAVPTVRRTCEDVADQFDATLVRINPRDAQVPDPRDVALESGALAALVELDEWLAS